jgi:hypothetical protein
MAMAYCPHCSFPVEEDARDCTNCGAQFGPGSVWKPTQQPSGPIPTGEPPVRRYEVPQELSEQEKPLRFWLMLLFVCTLPIPFFSLPLLYWLIVFPQSLLFPPFILIVGVPVLIGMSICYFAARLLARFLLRNANSLGGLLGIHAIVLIGTAVIAAIPMYCDVGHPIMSCSSLYGAWPHFLDAIKHTFSFLTGTMRPGI